MFPPRFALPVVLPVVLPFAVAAATLSLAAPASADVIGSTSTDDVVLYDHCQHHPISYDLLVSPGTALWRLEIQVADPQGHVSEGTVLSSATSSTTTGTVDVTFCGSESPGRYTVRGTGFYELIPAVQIPVVLPETSFQVRPAATRTNLAKKSLGHGHYRLTARVGEENEKGFVRANGVTVRIERLAHGAWKKLPGTTLTTVRGTVTTTVRGKPGTRLRAVVAARNNYAESASHPVTLK